MKSDLTIRKLQECIYLKEKLNCEKYVRRNMFEE